jgi:hypothetical protein
MGGVYGDIDSRVGFERMLRDARAITRRMLEGQPNNPIIATIDRQLDALERWTANGREPSEAERKTINIGLIAVRELDNVPDPEVQALTGKLYSVQNYVDEWPTDEQAANATSADYWRRFGL